MRKITCFKAYDVRGRVPSELDEDVAYRIGRGYATFVQPTTVAVGRDIRASSPALAAAVARGLTDSGVDVLDIGVGGTELAYFATFSRKLDGGIMVTASHNPPDYNGMKMVREESRPLSEDTGLKDIRLLAEHGEFAPAKRRGSVRALDVKPDYIAHLLQARVGADRPRSLAHELHAVVVGRIVARGHHDPAVEVLGEGGEIRSLGPPQADVEHVDA